MYFGKVFQIQGRDAKRETARHPSFSRQSTVYNAKGEIHVISDCSSSPYVNY